MRICWWVLRGSNPRHLRCKRNALPTELSTHTCRGQDLNLHALFKGTRTSILRVYQFHHLGSTNSIIANCAEERNRTSMELLPYGPEPYASTVPPLRQSYSDFIKNILVLKGFWDEGLSLL